LVTGPIWVPDTKTLALTVSRNITLTLTLLDLTSARPHEVTPQKHAHITGPAYHTTRCTHKGEKQQTNKQKIPIWWQVRIPPP
jgi:hypothetical protein